MKLNKYLFNTVNNKECGHGQPFGSSTCNSSMCPVQCFPGGHSLRLAFGSFFYRRILAVHSNCFSFFVVFGYTWFLVQSLFIRNLGRQSWREVCLCVWPWVFAWVFRLLFHGEVVLQLSGEVVHERSGEAVNELSGEAVHELRGEAVHELSGEAVL